MIAFPNFERIKGSGIRTLTERDLKSGGKKRFVVVGDIHGMHESFKSVASEIVLSLDPQCPCRKLLSSLSYDPSKDHLIHVGDILAKGPSSAGVIHQLSAANVTGVRGNHDEKVIEWRAWIEWVQSQRGGRAWLKDMEAKTPEELEALRKKRGRKWKIPDGWNFGGEHYWLARYAQLFRKHGRL